VNVCVGFQAAQQYVPYQSSCSAVSAQMSRTAHGERLILIPQYYRDPRLAAKSSGLSQSTMVLVVVRNADGDDKLGGDEGRRLESFNPLRLEMENPNI
jgi:hypothetical protein